MIFLNGGKGPCHTEGSSDRNDFCRLNCSAGNPVTGYGISTELALAAGCSVLDDDRLAAALDGVLARHSLDWDRFLGAAGYHCVERLACARLEALRPGIIPDRLRGALRRRSLIAAALHAAQTRVTVTTLAELQKSGIQALVLKGAGVAHLLYSENPAFRSSGDIDILVAPENFCAAERSLVEMGFHRTWPSAEPPPAARAMLLTLANVFDFRDPKLGHTIELHCRATMNPYALPGKFEEMAASSVEVDTTDGPLRTLDGALHIAYLCHHATTSLVFRLKWFGDIARAERRAGGGDCARIVADDPRALPQRPAQLVSQVLRRLEREIEAPVQKSTTRAEPLTPLGHVLASMEQQIYVPPARNIARLPVEIANLRFVLGLMPSWRAKAYEWLRSICDPRDALLLRLSPRFAVLYAIAAPIFSIWRLVTRSTSR